MRAVSKAHAPNTQFVIAGLRTTRCAIGMLAAPAASGVYAVFLRVKGVLSPAVSEGAELIYIGSSSDLAAREFDQHFCSRATGFSTLRRSIGAILKVQLKLSAVPRGSGDSETNATNYRFLEQDESRLTDWMCRNLEVGIYPCSNTQVLEKLLLSALGPSLNLTGWDNPMRKDIKRLRKQCADEAKRVLASVRAGG